MSLSALDRICSFLALALLVCCGTLSAADWVDMGPLNGTAEGHVWSRVINETGATVSRDESWQVSFAAPAILEFRLLCADPYPLEARVQSKNAYGEVSEYLLDRVAGGFHKKFSSVWNPQTTRDVRVLVSTRQPGTDQRYQLTLTLFDAAGKPLSASPPTQGEGVLTSAATTEFLGTWLRKENGSVAEYLQLVEGANGIDIIFLAPDARTVTGRLAGRLQAGVLSAASAERQVRIVVTGGELDYTSSNLDGTAAWNGRFTRAPR